MLAQTNFGGNLTIGGVPIFKFLQPPGRRATGGDADGSCMLVVATDAPLDARDLGRLAARAVFGLARTGSSYSNGSGDFAIAFSTSPEMRSRFNDASARARTILPTDATSPLFEAALEATEEAVYNSLFQATTVRSANGTAEAIPLDRVRELLKEAPFDDAPADAATIDGLAITVPGRHIPISLSAPLPPRSTARRSVRH